MAGRSDIEAGRAHIKIWADKSALVRSLKSIQTDLKAVGSTISTAGKWMMGLGAAMVLPIVAATKAWASAGDQMNDLAERVGITVEAMSALNFAANQSCVSTEALEGGMRKMQKAIFDAVQGGKESIETFRMLGVNLAALRDANPDEQFRMIAEAIYQIEDPTARAAMAMKVFGKTGTSLLPMLAEGRAGIERLEQKCKDLGLVMSSQSAKAADELQLKFELVGKVAASAAKNVGAALAPAFSELADIVTTNAAAGIKWIKAHQDIVVTVAKMAVGLVAAGGAVFGVGLAFRAAGAVAGVFVSAIRFAASGVVLLFSAINLALSPIRMVIGGIVSLTSAIVELGASIVSGVLKSAWSALESGASLAFRAVTSLAQGIWSTVSVVIPAIWNMASAVFEFGWNAGKALAWFVVNIDRAAESVWNLVAAAGRFGERIVDAFMRAADVVATFGQSSMNIAMRGIEAALTGVLSLAGGVLSLGVAIGVIMTLAGPFIAFFGGLWALAMNIGKALATIGVQIRNGIGAGIAGIRDDVGRLGNAFAGFGSFFTGWGDLFRKMGGELSAAFGRIWEDGKKAFAGIQDAIAAADWGLVWRIFKDAAVIAWGEVANVIQANWAKISQLLGNAGAGIWKALGDGADWIFTELQVGWINFVAMAKAAWLEVMKAVEKSISPLIKALADSGLLGAGGAALRRGLGSLRDSIAESERNAPAEAKSAEFRTKEARQQYENRVEDRRREAANNAAGIRGSLGGTNIGVPQAEIDAARADMEAASAEAKAAAARAANVLGGPGGAPGAKGGVIADVAASGTAKSAGAISSYAAMAMQGGEATAQKSRQQMVNELKLIRKGAAFWEKMYQQNLEIMRAT